jgi:ferric-dicitrate binding protein FerR (iron transport regulator)
MHELIGKYLAGEVTVREREEFLQWIENSDENKKEFELHRNSWEATRIKFDSQNGDVVFRKILNKIDEDQEHEISRIDNPIGNGRRFNMSMITKIAASLIFFATLAYFIKINRSTQSDDQKTVSFIIKQNPAGQKSKIYLPDGSEVVLNAESEISYPEEFSDSIRIVSLKGEAFFDVVKNPIKPFIVHSEDLSTTVLGTSFNVRAFDKDPVALVALQSGKVKVEFKNSEDAKVMFLDPGEVMTYNKSAYRAQKNEFDEEMLLGWKDGIIKFEDADVDHIFKTLSRWYGVKFEIENRKNQLWAYKGRFENDNLDNVLSQIKFVQDFAYDWKDQKTVIITLN